MSTDHDATIAANIGRAFDFLADVHEEPGVLARLPDGATLAFREIDVLGHVYRLTAARAAGAEWVAAISGYSLTAGAQLFSRPVVDGRSTIHDQATIVRTFRATGDTAEAALDALAAELKKAIGDAIAAGKQADLDEANQRREARDRRTRARRTWE